MLKANTTTQLDVSLMQLNSLSAERERQEFRRTWLSIPRFVELKGKAELYTPR
jgi:hypothetical protein